MGLQPKHAILLVLRKRLRAKRNPQAQFCGPLSSILHSEVLSKIDEAGKTFCVLFIKTNATIPYTSVYMRLACGYMTDEVENKIRNAVAAAANK